MLKDKWQPPKGRHLKSHKTISERILLFSAKNMFLKTLTWSWIKSTTIQRYTDQFFESQTWFSYIRDQIAWRKEFQGIRMFWSKAGGVLAVPGNSESFSKNFKNKPWTCSLTDKPAYTAVAKCYMAGILFPAPLSFSYNCQAFQNLIHPSICPVTK